MDLEAVRLRAARAIAPIKPADAATSAPSDLLLSAQRLGAGRALPPYHQLYMLVVDLLGFRNLGQWEKLAWSVPLDFKGQAYLLEHRKFGVGLFATPSPEAEAGAREIVQRLAKGVKAAGPYFDWRATEAIGRSEVNVVNKASQLYERFDYFAAAYRAKHDEAIARADEVIRTELPNGGWTVDWPARPLRKEAKWLALATIESFFSWSEHAFTLVAILRGQCPTAEAVGNLAVADWAMKFRAALDITDPVTKRFYDDLVLIRQQLRNLVAHGAFGKQGEAFLMHSGAGAAPVRVVAKGAGAAYRFGFGVDFVEDAAIRELHAFVDHLWSGEREAARIYIQDWNLPIVMTYARDGSYAAAMRSPEDMEEFARYLGQKMDDSANMDW